MNEQLSLGEFLRQERERRGVTIEQVASATKISVRLLHALESDHYGDLPAKPFVRGFVSSYSLFVGLDSKDVLTRYGRFLESETKTAESDETRYAGYAFEKRQTDRSRTILWIVMGTCIALGGVAMFVLKPVLRKHKTAHVEKLQQTLQPTNKTPTASPAPPLATAAPTGATPPSENPKEETKEEPGVEEEKAVSVSDAEEEDSPSKVEDPSKDPLNRGDDLDPSQIRTKVVFKALANVWVRYKSDARPVTEFVLLKGKLLVVKAQEEIHFQASNSNALQIRYKTASYRDLDDVDGVGEANGNAVFSIGKGGN